jgi:hypothetical protein
MTAEFSRRAEKNDPQDPKAGPSGATDRLTERVEKFDEEGGAQPQAESEQEVDAELARARQEESKQASDPNLEQRGDAHSMGSEGRLHSEPGQQKSPATFSQDGKNHIGK